MSLQVGVLILAFFALSAATVNGQEPECNIPDGHYDGEPYGYWDPEPRSG